MDGSEWDKLAKEDKYFDEILSPFSSDASKKKLFSVIKKYSSKKKSVIDLGTGLGFSIPFLEDNFKEVTAIDFSKRMVKHASKNKGKNITVEQGDIRDLSNYQNKFDAAVSINSIILPSVRDIKKIFNEIFGVLKEGGVFIGVIPSMDSALYVAMLVQEKQLKRFKEEKKAMTNAARIVGKSDYDFLTGTFDNSGRQKFFYRFEVVHRLKKAGFKKIKISKLHYPWDKLENDDFYFPKEEKPWDWMVVAEKS